jgi:hypothetical protein
MLVKYCSRCYFAVAGKRRTCEICGNPKFVSAEELADPIAQPRRTEQISKALNEFSIGLKHDLIDTAQKSQRAARQIVALVRNEKYEEHHTP